MGYDLTSILGDLRDVVEPCRLPVHEPIRIDCAPVVAYHRFIVEHYTPPPWKRFLVFFQCSVRHPFSKSPSHGPMRRAIKLATGFDPRKEDARCPVHVVVMASQVGPVPYELEQSYPAVAGRFGVKHLAPEQYAQVKPILAERMAQYIRFHGAAYQRMASFTEGRYAEVMQEAMWLAGADFPIFPRPEGPAVIKQGSIGKGKPRTYWAQYWIQLFMEVVSWLEPEEQEQAWKRLERIGVTWGI